MWNKIKQLKVTIDATETKIDQLNEFPLLDLSKTNKVKEQLRQSVVSGKEKVDIAVKNLQQLRFDSKKARKEFLTQKAYVENTLPKRDFRENHPGHHQA